MSGDDNESAREGQEHPARRASDRPHAFQRNKGFRTCGVCGLPKKHEIHNAQQPAKQTTTEERPPQSIEQLRERLPYHPPPRARRFALSEMILVSGGLIGVVAGLLYLALFALNNAIDDPLQEILKDPANHIIRASAQVDGLNYNTLVFDLTETSGGASRLDIFLPFLQYAGAMKDRYFSKVILASHGTQKFSLQGDYFRQLGEEYRRENLVYTIRSFPPHLTAMDGSKPFAEYTNELLENVTKEVAQFTRFSDEWYANDSGLAPVETGISTAMAAEHVSAAVSVSANDNWLLLDSRNEKDGTSEISLHNAGTEGAVLTIHCANHKTEVDVDTVTISQEEKVRGRFDDSAPVRQRWDKSGSYYALVASDANAFVRRLANAHIFRFEFAPFDKQERIVVFDVSGLDSKLQRISDTCDWSPTGKNYATAKPAPAAAK